MLRVLAFLSLVVTVGGGLAFVAAQSGEMVLLVAGHRIVLGLFTAVCLLLGGLAVVLLFWWLVRVIIGAPGSLRSHFGARRQQRGHQALSQGLIAAMSGDVKAAKRLTKQSHALLTKNEAPLLPLLEAETKRLELDYKATEEIFHAMLDEPQTKLIGLKGLYREAIRQGEERQAGLYAAKAAHMDASLEWAVRASVTHYALEGHWDEALKLFERHNLARHKTKRLVQKSDMASWHVTLMSALAQSLLDDSPKLALEQALQAHKLAPDFVPAAALAAKSYFKLGENKKAEKLIEGFWRKNPHPELGQIYLDGDLHDNEGEMAEQEKLQKLHRALRLEKLNPRDPVSKMLVAQAALQAGDFEKARNYGEDLLTQSPSESVFLLLAECHGALGSDEGIIRHYLTQAVMAEPDMAWMVDGQIEEHWVAISPLSRRIGACVWQRPAKHAPPLLALPAATIVGASTAQDDTDEAEIPPQQAVMVTPSTQPPPLQEMDRIATQMPLKQAPNKPVFLPDQDVRQKSPHTPSNSPLIGSPTRIIVDDPGIGEEESENRA